MRRSLTGLFVLMLACVALAVDVSDQPNPLKSAKVGDWVLYELMGGMQQRQTVVNVTPDAVTLKIETIMNTQVINTMETSVPLNPKGTGTTTQTVPKVSVKTSRENVLVNGKSLDCLVSEAEVSGMVTKTWMSKEIPVTGIVKIQAGSNLTMKLIDWGRK